MSDCDYNYYCFDKCFRFKKKVYHCRRSVFLTFQGREYFYPFFGHPLTMIHLRISWRCCFKAGPQRGNERVGHQWLCNQSQQPRETVQFFWGSKLGGGGMWFVSKGNRFPVLPCEWLKSHGLAHTAITVWLSGLCPSVAWTSRAPGMTCAAVLPPEMQGRGRSTDWEA